MLAGWASSLVAALQVPSFSARPAAAVCPAQETYRNKWLVIGGTFVSDREAQELAAREGWCVVPGSSFSGLKSEVFAVVAGAHKTRKAAMAQVGAVVAKRKGAYVKAAGAFCPNPLSLSADVARRVGEIDRYHADAECDVNEQSQIRFWDFEGTFCSGGNPAKIKVEFHQGEYVRDELYAFSGNHLSSVVGDQWWDISDPKTTVASEPSLARRYYLVNDTCYFKTRVPPRVGTEFVCLEACPAGTRDKLIERAKLVAKAARTHGDDLEPIVDQLGEWVDDLGADRVR